MGYKLRRDASQIKCCATFIECQLSAPVAAPRLQAEQPEREIIYKYTTIKVVPGTGIEPVQHFCREILSLDSYYRCMARAV
jgi:hypothetical protein